MKPVRARCVRFYRTRNYSPNWRVEDTHNENRMFTDLMFLRQVKEKANKMLRRGDQ